MNRETNAISEAVATETTAPEAETEAGPEATTSANASAEGTPDSAARAEGLARALREEKEYRQDERFLFLFAIVILLNVIVFDALGGWIAPIVLLILELAFLVALARLMGIEEVVDLARRLGRWSRSVFDLTVQGIQSLRKPRVTTE